MFLAIVAVLVTSSRWIVARKVVFASCATLPVGAFSSTTSQSLAPPSGSYPTGWLLQGKLAGLAGLLLSPSRGLLLF
jgi:hypothetical protein